jgi:hypothetical protein
LGRLSRRNVPAAAAGTAVRDLAPEREDSVSPQARLWDHRAVDFAERAARNEEIFRGVNERIEEGVERHGVASAVPYHCECGDASCFETVELRPSDYEHVLRERYRFIVLPGHENPTIEHVVERHSGHLVVEKTGEAREQLDQDHPQAHHQPDDN